MKAHSALIFVEHPDPEAANAKPQQGDTWSTFVSEMQSVVKQTPNTENQNGILVLLRLENGLSPMTRIFESAQRNNLKYRVLFLEEEREWIKSS